MGAGDEQWESRRREEERGRPLGLRHCIMGQSAKLEERSSLVLVVWGQNSGQREILYLKRDLKVLCLRVSMLICVYGFPVKDPVLMWWLVCPLML